MDGRERGGRRTRSESTKILSCCKKLKSTERERQERRILNERYREVYCYQERGARAESNLQ